MKNDVRVTMTKSLLRKGLYRCLSEKPISRITVTDLCKEAGVNRATFYNHYESPAMIIREVVGEVLMDMRILYYETKRLDENQSMEKAVEACLRYLDERREPIRLLLSDNAENLTGRFCLDLIDKRLERFMDNLKGVDQKRREELFLYSVTVSSAIYALIKAWIIRDIKRKPEDVIRVLKWSFGEDVFTVLFPFDVAAPVPAPVPAPEERPGKPA